MNSFTTRAATGLIGPCTCHSTFIPPKSSKKCPFLWLTIINFGLLVYKMKWLFYLILSHMEMNMISQYLTYQIHQVFPSIRTLVIQQWVWKSTDEINLATLIPMITQKSSMSILDVDWMKYIQRFVIKQIKNLIMRLLFTKFLSIIGI